MNLLRGLCSIAILAFTAIDADAQISTTECRLTAAWLPAVSAQCTTLTVLEDATGPADGTEIGLLIARVPSLNVAPQEDPLVIIAGGPGQAATDFYPRVRAAFEPIRRDRDIVLIDQRGTGNSAPLTCPQISAATVELAEPETLPALMEACLAELDGDPRFYTTSLAVRDLEHVREALGVEQWNLYGVSYGTRVAQHYLRRYPQRTRALILDGVVPNEAPLGPDVAAQSQRVLDQIMTRCATEPACADRYPQIAAQLDALLASLLDEPVTVGLADPHNAMPRSRQLSHAHVAAVLRLLSYSPQTAALLPLLIDAAGSGNLAPLAAQVEMITSDLESELSLPMHNAVVCTEDVPFFAATTPPEIETTYLGTTLIDALRAVCGVWPRGVLDADLREPLRSDRPALLLSGDSDPITPPDYAEQVLVGLSNARHIVGPGQGHGLAGVGCVPRLMRDFLDTLEPATLEATCLEREQASPFFLDFNGPAP
jgi:pimeloyl-ACP methyl ester carboxylesterase